MRNVWSDFIPMIPATACHQRNYFETDSRYRETMQMLVTLEEALVERCSVALLALNCEAKFVPHRICKCTPSSISKAGDRLRLNLLNLLYLSTSFLWKLLIGQYTSGNMRGDTVGPRPRNPIRASDHCIALDHQLPSRVRIPSVSQLSLLLGHIRWFVG